MNMAIHIEMMDENYLAADILGIALADEERTLLYPICCCQESPINFKKLVRR